MHARCIIFALFMSILAACQVAPSFDQQLRALDEHVLAGNRSSVIEAFVDGYILTDNDHAFENKLALINTASHSIDIAYYIFDDDYSSSVLSQALLDATTRGVAVRVLVDYHSAYKDLDRFSMLEYRGNLSTGSLQVKLYNRPTPLMIKDAIFMTLGCHHSDLDKRAGCSQTKLADIDRLVSESDDISNMSHANSGLFLSGFYAKNPQLMALAVNESQQLSLGDLPQSNSGSSQQQALQKLGQIYWQAYYGSTTDRVINRAKLSMAFLVYGDTLNPIYDAFSSFLPVERPQSTAVRRDWDFATDFLHHKLLWVDQKKIQLGGRNVQDAYHIQQSSLSDKYTFVDSDVAITLEEPNVMLTTAYDRLWYYSMTASVDEVRLHAPNDFLVAQQRAAVICAESTVENCREMAFKRTLSIPLWERMEQDYQHMIAHAETFRQAYQPQRGRNLQEGAFTIDPEATISYIENVPFSTDSEGRVSARHYGSTNGKEAGSGKHIHAVWLSALKSVCEKATFESPQHVVFYNAYVFFPSNILSQLAQMIDGRQPCANVTIDVLTNSIATTDLNVVNILSRHSIKALLEHAQEHHRPEVGARFRYYETQLAHDSASTLSLHAKVMLLGDRIFIGSANADLRSLIMDTNNGVLIDNAPKLVAEYWRWFNVQFNDESKTVNKTNEYMRMDRAALVADDEKTIDALIERYRIDRFVEDDSRIRQAKEHVLMLLEDVYQLSQEIVKHHGLSKKAQARFDSMFKLI